MALCKETSAQSRRDSQEETRRERLFSWKGGAGSAGRPVIINLKSRSRMRQPVASPLRVWWRFIINA